MFDSGFWDWFDKASNEELANALITNVSLLNPLWVALGGLICLAIVLLNKREKIRWKLKGRKNFDLWVCEKNKQEAFLRKVGATPIAAKITVAREALDEYRTLLLSTSRRSDNPWKNEHVMAMTEWLDNKNEEMMMLGENEETSWGDRVYAFDFINERTEMENQLLIRRFTEEIR